jgi:hypothetical protein
MATVIEIVSEHLKSNGFDGLRNGRIGCGCEIGDLAPCSQYFGQCEGSYQHYDHKAGYYKMTGSKTPPTPEEWREILDKHLAAH